MSKSQAKSETTGLSFLDVALYLFLIPLAFTASLHFMEHNNRSPEVRLEALARTEMSKLKYLIADSAEVRKHLAFYSPENKYVGISQTNEAFNYSLPVLGLRQLKIIKGKEDNIFRSATHQQYVVSHVNAGQLHRHR
jgi:hypothetical protein